MVQKRQRRFATRAVALLASLAWLGLMFGSAELLSGSKASARHAMTERLQTRIAAAAQFASEYTRDIFGRERAQAATWLSGQSTGTRELKLAAAAVGARMATLLDSHGEVLRAEPAQPGLQGVNIALEYPYLTAAMDRGSGVSNVVPSTAEGASIVAFAVSFATSSGRRVFSLAFAVSRTPLGAFASHVLTLPRNHIYLIDASGTLITGGRSTEVGTPLAQRDRNMSAALARETVGTYSSPSGTQVLASARVAGTPWRLVASEPAGELFATIDQNSESLAWAGLAGLAFAGLVIIAIGVRWAHSRSELVELATQLDRLARVDALTDLSNRRDLDETLHAALSVAMRAQRPLAVLLIDIDHFKQVNDTLGHDAGDVVLMNIAQAMRATLRTGDSLGRWGGEEFLAVLPDTDSDEAAIVAGRIHDTVRRTITAGQRTVTVTIGVAVYDSDTKDELITRADAALYAGKASGRDTVQIAAPRNNAPVALALV